MNLDTSYVSFFSKKNINLNENMLSLVYMPVIKADAFSLYKFLFSQTETSKIKNNDDFFSFKYLKEFVGMKLSIIKKSFKKLGAIGLVDYFYNNDDNEAVFIVKSPLNFKDFFSNKKYKKLFLKKTSKKYFEFLNNYFLEFKPSKLPNFKNVTESFKYKVFDEEDNIIDIDDNFIKNNMENIETEIEKDLISYNTKTDDKYEKDLKIKNLDIETKNSDDEILITNNTNNLNNKLENDLPIQSSSLDKKIIFYYDDKFNDDENFRNKKLTKIKTTPSEEYFEQIKENKLNDYDIAIITMLLMSFKLKPEIVNAIIEYTYLTNNKTINKSYISKIATSFINHSITNVEDAIIYLNNAYTYNRKNDKKASDSLESIAIENTNENEISLENKNNKELFDFDEEAKSLLFY